MTVRAQHRVVVSIFEEGKDYPAVVHIFYGQNVGEAQAYFKAHMRTDSFLEACVTKKRFANMTCHAEKKVEHWDGQRWT